MSRVCAPGMQRGLRVCSWLWDACCVLVKRTIGRVIPCVHFVLLYKACGMPVGWLLCSKRALSDGGSASGGG